MAALTGIAITYALVILPVVGNWMIAKAQNTITPENKTSQGAVIKMIIKDNIVRIINTTTNETTSVRNLAENTGNTTTNENLTSKFNELQGK